MEVASAVTQQALFQTRVATEVLKSNAAAEQALVNIISDAARNAPVSSSLGTQLDVSA